MIKRPILLCDLDETIFNLTAAILPFYNKEYGQNINIDDIDDYNVANFLHDEAINIYREFSTKELFESLCPIDGSIEILTELSDKADIYFATAAYVNTVGYRNDLLKKYFSFYTEDKLIICKNKQLLKGAILIDDAPHNLFGGEYIPIVYDQKWNRSISRRKAKRIYGWNEESLRTIKDILGI